jgi:predicted nucleic acid-binding protein
MTKRVLRGPVVVDTGVFAAELTRSGVALAERYRPLVEGRNVFISFVTEAEVRFGAKRAGWGAARMRKLEQRLATAEVVWPGPQLVEEYADLRAWCVANGHGLGQKEHEADRWVAATARWLDLPLVSDDQIFDDVWQLSLAKP